MTHPFRLTLWLTLALAALPLGAAAQGQFSPAITVDGRVITNYEVDQRIMLLELFRAPGDLPRQARDGLIEDRLKQDELARVGVSLTDEGLQTAMEEFAGRANLTLDQFTTVLNQNGVDQAALRDFVRVGVSWRDYVRSRFGARTEVSEAEIDRAIGQGAGTGAAIEVLLNEIIIAAPPPQAARAMETAVRISQLTSTDAFEAEARRVSALPSRANGGRLDWLPITNYPPELRSIILALGNGQVTTPIQITNGIALFQMRGTREVRAAIPAPDQIEYAALYLSGGQSEAGRTAAARVAAQVDTCDDLYGVARALPPEQLERVTLPIAQIPTDVAMELARLDPGEYSTGLTRANGQTLVFLMLCKRVPAAAEGVDREAVANQLRAQRIGGFGDALLADLKAAATITYN